MALVNPPTLQLNPFRYDHAYQPNPIRPILGGQWGPPDQSKQFQEGIAGILPALGEAYKGVRGQMKAEEAEAETRLIGTDQSPAAKVAALGSTIYGNPPVLDAGTPGGTGDPGLHRGQEDTSYALLRQEEGFRNKPYNDAGSLRVGYGSDTYTTTSGEVGKVGPGTMVTRDMAEADLRRRVTDFQAGIRKDIPDFDLMSAGTKAALTSVAYNYGSLPSAVVEAARSGNNQVLAATVAGLGANPERRQREAALILSSSATSAQAGNPATTAAAQPRTQVAAVGPAGVAPTAANPSAVPTYDAFKAKMTTAFPQLQITSEARSPQHNRDVGGASGSQHLSGRAMDVSVRGMNDSQKQAVLQQALENGARGIGYYPKSESFHFDVRPGAYAAWGPDYHSTSLNQTPPWFQQAAAALTSGNSPGTGVSTQVAGTPGGNPPPNAPQPLAGSPYDATKPVPPNQAIQPMPGQNPSAVAPSQIAQPQQRPPQPQQAALQPPGLQPPPPPPQAAQAPPQAAQAPPRPVQVASADPGFVPGGPAPGPGIAIDPNTGQRQAVDANGNPLPAAGHLPTVTTDPSGAAVPAPASRGTQVAGGGQRPPVTRATPQDIAQTAAQVDPHYRNALAAAIGSRDPTVMRGVIEAGEKLLGGRDQYDFVNGPDGNMYRVNKRTGVPELAIRGAGKPTELKEINGVTHEWDGQKWTPRAGGVQKAPETKDINGVTHQWDGSKWVAMPTGPQKWRNATKEEREAAGVGPDAGPMQISTDGEIKFPAKAGGSTNVSVNAGETEEQKALGKARADAIVKTGNAAEAARGTLRSVARMRQMLDMIQTGKIQPGTMTIGQIASQLGMSDDTLRSLNLPDKSQQASAVVMQSMAGKMVSDKLAAGEFPANNFSNPDREFLIGQLPGIGQPKIANELLLRAMQIDAQRNIDKQSAWRKFKLANGGAKADWDEFNDGWQEQLDTTSAKLFENATSEAEAEQFPKGSIVRITRPDGSVAWVEVQ